MRRHRLLLMLLTAVAFLYTGCAGHLPTGTAAGNMRQVPADGRLPALPYGDAELRQAATFDGVPVDGHPAFSSSNATPDGTSLLLESGSDAWNITAWAIYQLPESPGDAVDMISVTAQYLDPDPVISRPEEGYWLGYADYASGSWQLSGPFRTLQSRVEVPPEADVVSSMGFYYVLVLVNQEHQALVQRVEVGGYDGMGYEEYWLGRPPGHSRGEGCDIQLDPDGNPQIAYFNKPYVLNDHLKALRVARKTGAEWVYEDIDPGFEPDWFSFALGDGGRRILIHRKSTTNDLFMQYDDNTGSFAAPVLVASGIIEGVRACVTFVNDSDDPLGDLNMAIITYAKPSGADMQTQQRTYDGAVLTPEALVFPGPTTRVERLIVTTNKDNLAVIGVPDKVGADWYCNAGRYSGGVWDFTVALPWGPLESCAEYDDMVPDIQVRESPTGDFVGCYMRESLDSVGMARYSGGAWLSTAKDVISIKLNNYIEIDTFASGRTVLANTYGDLRPLLQWGLSGAGETYGQAFLDTEPWTATFSSIAVDDANNVHMAAFNAVAGKLNYIVRPPSEVITQEVVDYGGLDVGGSAFYAWPVYANGSQHLFYVNSTHPGVLHAENVNGIWTTENEVIVDSGIPYYVLGAGYLEDLNLLYVCYLDYLDIQVYILSGTPGDDNWVKQSPGFVFSEIAFVDDDESNIGIVGAQPNPLLDTRVVFLHGQPQAGNFTMETITLNISMLGFRSDLGFNPFDGTWGFACTSSGGHRVSYFQRTAPNNWIGPYTVAELGGAGELVSASGLTYLAADGTPRIVVRQIANIDSEYKTVVYTASPGGTSFSSLVKIQGLFDGDGLMPYATAVPGPGGEPAIAVMSKLTADTTFDISLYISDAPGSWILHETWDSPLLESFPQISVAEDGQPAAAAIENNRSLGTYGGVVTYYPW